jgi:hypothetical protein
VGTWKEEFILYPDSRVVKTGTGCISLKREIIILLKILVDHTNKQQNYIIKKKNVNKLTVY